MPQPLGDALADVRALLLDPDQLVRAVASGRRRGAPDPAHVRAELRPVALKAGPRLQVVTTDGLHPITQNVEHGRSGPVIDALLAEPFATWYIETRDAVVQLRVTKRGEAQVHVARTSRRAVQSHDRVKQRLLEPDDPLFGLLGAGADKRRQVDAFLRLLAPVAEPALQAARAQARPLRVVDLGCGNAYLTFAAHRWLSRQAAAVGVVGAGTVGVHTVGVDVRDDVVARNTALAQQLGMSGIEFQHGAIADMDLGGDAVDVVLALHACDTATDEALAVAVRLRAGVVLAAPCCHHDIQRQLTGARAAGTPVPYPFAGLTRHPILAQRFADVLTDALRADLLRLLGYRVDVVEFVDSRHTPRNAMVRATFTGAPSSPERRSEYTDVVAAFGVHPALAAMLAPELESAGVESAGVESARVEPGA